MIDWEKIGKEDMEYIEKVVKRTKFHDRLELSMDITAAHLDHPLNLKGLSVATEFDFWHDITGIINNLNRKTGKLENCFSPRYSV